MQHAAKLFQNSVAKRVLQMTPFIFSVSSSSSTSSAKGMYLAVKEISGMTELPFASFLLLPNSLVFLGADALRRVQLRVVLGNLLVGLVHQLTNLELRHAKCALRRLVQLLPRRRTPSTAAATRPTCSSSPRVSSPSSIRALLPFSGQPLHRSLPILFFAFLYSVPVSTTQKSTVEPRMSWTRTSKVCWNSGSSPSPAWVARTILGLS